MVSRLNQLVSAGAFPSKAEAVRTAVAKLLDELDSTRLDATLVDAYRRVPDEQDDPWLEAATRAMVEAEPW
jgi:Arc/MetJ-type ribon-helix-helix transcriptional regulator